MWYRPHNNLKQLKTIKMKFIEVKAITGKKLLINTKHIVSIKEGFLISKIIDCLKGRRKTHKGHTFENDN